MRIIKSINIAPIVGDRFNMDILSMLSGSLMFQILKLYLSFIEPILKLKMP